MGGKKKYFKPDTKWCPRSPLQFPYKYITEERQAGYNSLSFLFFSCSPTFWNACWTSAHINKGGQKWRKRGIHCAVPHIPSSRGFPMVACGRELGCWVLQAAGCNAAVSSFAEEPCQLSIGQWESPQCNCAQGLILTSRTVLITRMPTWGALKGLCW